MIKKIGTMIAINLGIVVAAVVLYSPGMLCLRITDENIFRAGTSVIAMLLLVSIFLFTNIRLLKGPPKKLILPEDEIDIEKAKTILKGYGNSKYFKDIASTASKQADRIQKCHSRLSEILEQKFSKGTMSWDKFYSVVMSAEDSATRNMVAMANRLQLFDEKELETLEDYQDDDIPDDVQEDQIRLYEKNYDEIRSLISLNEKILLKLNSLAMEISVSADESNLSRNDGLIEEIEDLIDQTKYYA